MFRTLRKCIGVLLVCIIVLMILSQQTNNSNQQTYTEEAITVDIPNNPYNDSNFYNDNSWLRYEDDTYTSLVGIDVSSHQEVIDWSLVKSSGVDFAMIRLGYRGYESGEIHDDAYFVSNMQQATNQNIETGVYFFSQAITIEEAIEEANYVLLKIVDYSLAFPIVYDMEYVGGDDRISQLSIEEKTQIALAFCQTIESAGYTPMIYGSASWFNDDVFLGSLLDYPRWVASYNSTPGFAPEFIMWQYTNKGSIEGIDGEVDFNIYFKKK